MPITLTLIYNYHIIRGVQEEYISDRTVYWKPISLNDNLECINMMEDKTNGLFALLGLICKSPQPSAQAFLQELFKKHDNNPSIKRAKSIQSEQVKCF